MLRIATFFMLATLTSTYAQDWGAMATISSTMGVQGGKLCLGEASRGDIGCPTYAPSVSPTGTLTTTAISLTTGSTNWGYLGNNASYLPNLNSNVVSTTTLTVNGNNITGMVSPTNVPAFRAYKSANQTVTAGTWTKIVFNSEEFDNLNNFNTGTSRFQPTIAGHYLMAANTYCGVGATICYITVYKNGTATTSEGGGSVPSIATVVYLNGTTDYIEVYGYTDATSFVTGISSFSGSLLASGNGLTGGDTTPTGAIMAFDLAACPSGWSEYTPARGRFLRGIDNGAGNDPSGTRAIGNTQADAFQDHFHTLEIYSGTPGGAGGNWQLSNSAMTTTNSANYDPYPQDPAMKWASYNGGGTGYNYGFRASTETRPKNVAVLYCRKD